MTFMLKKKTSLDGETTYEILVDDAVHRTYSEKKLQHAYDEAQGEYKRIIQRRKEGYPKEEVLLTETVE